MAGLGKHATVLTDKQIALALDAVATRRYPLRGQPRTCKTIAGGRVVCGDLIIGITLDQYQDRLKRRADEIRSEEAQKRNQIRKLGGADRARNERGEGKPGQRNCRRGG